MNFPYPLRIPGTLRGSRPELREVTQISPKSSKTYDSITSRSSGASPEFFSDIFPISSKSLKKTCHLLKIIHQQRPPPNSKHILASRPFRIPIRARIGELKRVPAVAMPPRTNKSGKGEPMAAMAAGGESESWMAAKENQIAIFAKFLACPQLAEELRTRWGVSLEDLDGGDSVQP